MVAFNSSQAVVLAALIAGTGVACGETDGQDSNRDSSSTDGRAETGTGGGDVPDAAGDSNDAPVDASEEPFDAAPWCTVSLDAGALGAAEVLASDRPGLTRIGLSDSGPVWLEETYAAGATNNVVLMLLRDVAKPVAVTGWTVVLKIWDFGVAGDNYAISLFAGHPPNSGLDWGLIPGGRLGTGLEYYCVDRPGITVDRTHLYASCPALVDPATIYRSEFGAPSNPAAAVYTGGTTMPVCMSTGDTHLYWFLLESSAEYAIQRMPKSGGGIETLGHTDRTPPHESCTLAVQSASLFWVFEPWDSGLTHAIDALPAGAATPRRLADDPHGVRGLAVDDDYVYWASGETQIKRVRHCGGTPEIIADNQDVPIDIAVDDSAVYWLNRGAGYGSVMRMRKQ